MEFQPSYKKMTMRRAAAIPVTVLTFALTVCAQVFEGTIVYQNTYKSKVPNITDQQLTSMFGSRQIYMIKGGDYKSTTNGMLFLWQLYINKDNKLYNKMSTSEEIRWYDGGHTSAPALNIEVNRAVADILGYKCDEVILRVNNGVEKYYFNSKLGVDISLYSKHLYGNWYDYLKIAKAIPLKSVIENSQFLLTSVATEIKATKLDDKEFQLPENVKIAKSPS